jgi:hypothetical protein
LCGETVAGLGVAAPARFARRAQLAASPVAPRRSSEGVEGVSGGTQRGAQVGNAPLSSQPLAMREEAGAGVTSVEVV